jgi:hypothetical protein
MTLDEQDESIQRVMANYDTMMAAIAELTTFMGISEGTLVEREVDNSNPAGEQHTPAESLQPLHMSRGRYHNRTSYMYCKQYRSYANPLLSPYSKVTQSPSSLGVLVTCQICGSSKS